MWYLEIGDYAYNFTGIVLGVFLIAFILGALSFLNEGKILKRKKRWQQILLRAFFIEAIVATIIFSYPKCSANLDAKMVLGAYAFSLVAVFLCAVVAFFVGGLIAMVIKWIFAKPES